MIKVTSEVTFEDMGIPFPCSTEGCDGEIRVPLSAMSTGGTFICKSCGHITEIEVTPESEQN